jgi:hypothetical protein
MSKRREGARLASAQRAETGAELQQFRGSFQRPFSSHLRRKSGPYSSSLEQLSLLGHTLKKWSFSGL